jgi:Rrf2 family protein
VHFTRATNYAVRALAVLAHDGCRTDQKTLASRLGVPPAFLGKVLQALSRSGLVESCRGVKGGFRLSRPPGEITMRQVVEAVEGGVRLSPCAGGIGCEKLEEIDCRARKLWLRLERTINEALEAESLLVIAGECPEGRAPCGTTPRR